MIYNASIVSVSLAVWQLQNESDLGGLINRMMTFDRGSRLSDPVPLCVIVYSTCSASLTSPRPEKEGRMPD